LTGKADFSDLYNASDPRGLYARLHGLDYQVPGHGAPVFRRLVEVLAGAARGDAPVTVLDVCCSFGINAALLNHHLTVEQVMGRYAAPALATASSEQLLTADREFFAAARRRDAVRLIGQDISAPAAGYARAVGLLDDAVVADLESGPPPADLAERLAGVDLVTVTGGIGYVGGRTFDQVVNATGARAWVAALVLRWIGFEDVAEALSRYGYTTETVPGYQVRQRRYADDRERAAVRAGLAPRGLAPSADEDAGGHVAELVLARPLDAVRAQPLSELGLQELGQRV
jgi:hypothetical protein